jgi:hypothetical protein
MYVSVGSVLRQNITLSDSAANQFLVGDSPLSKWRVHLLKGLVRTAVSVHLKRFGE